MVLFLKFIGNLCLVALIAGLLYLLAWPVPIIPAAWEAPPNPGYTGPHARNSRLAGFEYLPLSGQRGPEAVTFDNHGRLYASTHGGWIVRFGADGRSAEPWFNTGGRPLGLAFHPNGNLIVADGIKGLLSISPRGDATQLVQTVGGHPIAYADDVTVARDGKIYFTDASVKFPPAAYGGTYEAALLDLMEHGGNGRLIVYDPAAKGATELLKGLNFPNGVAVSHDQQSVLVVETGNYRVLRHWVKGDKKGRTEPVLENLPGFPDNVTSGNDGRYWLALASPRNRFIDFFAPWPIVRKFTQRLPAKLRPQAKAYGHLIAFDDEGKVLLDLQDPQGRYPMNTSAREGERYLYVGSLIADRLGRIPKTSLGL